MQRVSRFNRKKPKMLSTFNPLDHPDAEVPRAYFCQLTGRSRITAYKHERFDPTWPRPVIRGGRVFYKAADCKRYLEAPGEKACLSVPRR